MGWEDTFLPEIRRCWEEGGRQPRIDRKVLWKRWPPKTTPNHRAMIRALSYRDDRARAREEVLEWLDEQLEPGRAGFQYGEQLSTIYDPFWHQCVAFVLSEAHRTGDEKVAGRAARWFRATLALYQLTATPGGEIIAPGCRCYRSQNRDRGVVYRILAGRPTKRDRRVVEAIASDRKDGNGRPIASLNNWQLFYVSELVDRGALETGRLGREEMLAALPPLRHTMQVRRTTGGHLAWCDELECAGGHQWEALVEYVDTRQQPVFERNPSKVKAVRSLKMPRRPSPPPPGELITAIEVGPEGAKAVAV